MIFKIINSVRKREEQSRRDGILLTVGFNLWMKKSSYPQSPAGTILCGYKVSSLRDLDSGLFCAFRRLKSTVNKGLSLRDIYRSNPVINCLFFIPQIVNLK